ncbi:hypothetical protein [Cohnella candidum]|uniref:Uncharacterized protein n=1 Tax=Cohnella candidum TaxID=2674991 RepID=A0A3G3K035_9BACL|nr:hypothetical protein [Cohnella candidum]AYQ73491.1 hypothetical protein EAV92_13435 [Cohnella candidum]
MALALYVGAAWLAAGVAFIACTNRPRQETAFLLLFFESINTHVYSFFDDLFHWFATSREPVLFTCFLLYRSAIAPALLTGAAIAFRGPRAWFGILAGTAVFALLDVLNASFKTVSLHEWNAAYAAAYFGLLLCAGVAALAGFRRLRS